MERRRFTSMSDVFTCPRHPEISHLHEPKKENLIRAMKKIITCFSLLLCTNLFFFPQVNLLHASSSNGTNAQRDLSVGVFSYYPIVFEKNGVPTGFHMELLKEVASKEGWNLDFKFVGSLKNLLHGLNEGTLDLGMGLVPTDEREKFLDFTKEKNAFLKGQVFVRFKQRDIQSMGDLNGKKVAYIREDVLGAYFVEVSEKLGVSPFLKQTNSYDDLLAAIIAGDVDAGIFSNLQGARYSEIYPAIRSTPIIFKPMEVQYAVAKGKNTLVIDTLDSYLRKFKTTEGTVYDELEERFLRAPLQSPKVMPKHDLLIILSIILLLIIFGIIVGFFMVRKIETGKAEYSSPYVRDIIVFTLFIGGAFWILDSLMLWYLFNEKHNLTLLELAITNIPPENFYIRGMFFLMCCFFGLFLVKYIGRYEEKYHLLLISVNRFEQLTDNARDMIFHMSLPSGRYDFVNKASAQIFGYPPEDFYKNPLFIEELIHPKWLKYFRTQWKNLLSGEIPPYFEFQIVSKAGDVRWVNQRNTLYYDSSGTPNALEGIVTDITEQKTS